MKIEDHATELALIDRMLDEVQNRLQALNETHPPLRAGGFRQLIRMRALREQHFGPGLFADPVWDILLELAASRLEGRPVPISALSAAVAIPATTVLRWVSILVDRNLVERAPDPGDRRRVFVRLSEEGARRMDAFAESVAASQPAD